MRWERLRVTIRCGLDATQPACIRIYLELGRWLVQHGRIDDRVAHEQMLRVLVDTARDDGLPWIWRSVCLEHAARPLARLTTLLKRHDAQSAQAWVDRLGAAQTHLAAVTLTRSTRTADG